MVTTKKLWWKIVAVVTSIALVCGMSNIFAFASSDDPDDGNFHMVVLGDSVAAGYGLQDWKTIDYPDQNIHSCPTDSYSYQVAEYVYGQLVADGYVKDQGDFGYFADRTDGFTWSNLAGCAFSASELCKVLTDKDYKTYYQQENYYDLYQSELKKADLVTVQIGNNDILINSLTAFHTNPAYSSNPAFLALEKILSTFAYGDIKTSEDLEALITQVIETYGDQITYDQLLELIEFLEPDSLSNYFLSYETTVSESLVELDSDIKSINPDAKVVYVGSYNPYGTDLRLPDGQGGYITYDFGTIVDRMLDKMQEVLDDDGCTTATQSAVLEQAASLLCESESEVSSVVSTLDGDSDISAIATVDTADADKLNAQSSLQTLGSERADASKLEGIEKFLTWTKANLANWKNWDSATWNTWVTQLKEYAATYSQASSIADAIDQIVDEGSLDSIEDVDALIAEIAQKTGSSIETVSEFLFKWGYVSTEFFVGDGESLKALAQKIRSNSCEYATLLVKFLFSSSEAKQAVAKQLVSDIEYPAMHIVLGTTIQAALSQLNEDIQTFAQETDQLYVYIMDIDNEADTDPHPSATGHEQIAQRIEAALTLPVSVSAGFGGTATTAADTGIYGAGTKVIIASDEGCQVSSITNNGEQVSLDNLTTNDDGTQSFIAEVDNSGANVAVTFSNGNGNGNGNGTASDNGGTGTSATTSNVTPDTGDMTLYLAAAVALMALAAAVALVVARRREMK